MSQKVTPFMGGLGIDATSKFEVQSNATVTVGDGTNGGNVAVGDNGVISFGAGSDLQIYHTGSTSYIFEQGTGDLRIRGSEVRIEDDDGSTIALFKEDAGVELRYDGAVKLESTATGVDVTGDVGGDTLTISGDVTLGTNSSNTISITGSIDLGTL